MPLFFFSCYAVKSSVGIPTTCKETEQVCASAPVAEIPGYCGNTVPVNVTPVVKVNTKASVVSDALFTWR